MKKIKTFIALLIGSLISTAAYAQVEVTVTGSTAFRSITIDRSGFLFDLGYTAVTNNATTGLITYSGTMSNRVPALGNTPVKLRLSFSGSAAGMHAVRNQTPIPTAETPGVNVNRVPDLALSDVFPGAATPPINPAEFDPDARLGVIPFVFMRNNAMTGVNNITRDQAVLLMTASGSLGGFPGMPATFLGGVSTAPIYLIGRDPESGTRITVEKDIGFLGTPLLWATNGAGAYVQTNGYSSGGLVRGTVAAKSDAIGYVGLADYAAVSNSVAAVNYDGVAFSPANVATGKYALWGYQHIFNRAGGLSANQALVKNALVGAITNPAYQNTPIYANSFVPLDDMHVERGADGGTITSLDF